MTCPRRQAPPPPPHVARSLPSRRSTRSSARPCAGSCETELRPARGRVGGGPVVPRRGVHTARRARATSGSSSRPSTAATATRWPTPCSSRSSRGAARAAWRRGSARTPGSRSRRSGGSAPRSRSSATWCRDPRREDRGAGHHRTRRRLRCGVDSHARAQDRRRLRGQRRQDVHHRRRPRRHARHRGQDDRGGRPPRHLVPDHRPRPGSRVERAREARLARLRHRADHLRRRVRARGEPARRRERGLLPDHGQLPVGAAADGARAPSAGCRSRSRRRCSTR